MNCLRTEAVTPHDHPIINELKVFERESERKLFVKSFLSEKNKRGDFLQKVPPQTPLQKLLLHFLLFNLVLYARPRPTNRPRAVGTGLGWGAVSEWETFWKKVSPQTPLQKLLTSF